MFEINPAAIESFNKKAAILVSQIVSDPRQCTKSHGSNSEVFISATITENEIIGEPKESFVDYKGRTISRFFNVSGKRYGLIGDSHKELVKLAESVQKLPVFRERLSKSFVEKMIFIWVQNEYADSGKHGGFISFLVLEASKVVKPITILVPIANTTVEMPFEFCGTTIRNLTKAEVDEMSSTSNLSLNDDQRKTMGEFYGKFRSDFQGYAVVEIMLTCEPDYANDLAISIACKITDLLGIYSNAVLIPDLKCTSKIKGTENLATYTTLIKNDSNRMHIKKGVLDIASINRRCISIKDFDEYLHCGLSNISGIVVKKERTDFEKTVLNMALLYSKAAFTSDPMEKCVHMLSALESTLLKNENEPIQHNLAERIAVFTASELIERKEIIKNIKHVYGLRSRYLHHGHSSTELEELSTFFKRVFIFYVQLATNSDRFKSKEKFIEAIDDHKLS